MPRRRSKIGFVLTIAPQKWAVEAARLLGPFRSLTLAQPHAGAAAVLVDEFDGGF
jgi:hypothetical protein